MSELLQTNLLRVFNNRDAADRRATIDAIYAEDVVFRDHTATTVGRDEVDRRAGELLAGIPADVEFAEVDPAYVDGDTGAIGWRLGPADAPIVRGMDLITVADGRIVSLQVLLAG